MGDNSERDWSTPSLILSSIPGNKFVSEHYRSPVSVVDCLRCRRIWALYKQRSNVHRVDVRIRGNPLGGFRDARFGVLKKKEFKILIEQKFMETVRTNVRTRRAQFWYVFDTLLTFKLLWYFCCLLSIGAAWYRYYSAVRFAIRKCFFYMKAALLYTQSYRLMMMSVEICGFFHNRKISRFREKFCVVKREWWPAVINGLFLLFSGPLLAGSVIELEKRFILLQPSPRMGIWSQIAKTYDKLALAVYVKRLLTIRAATPSYR